MTELKKTKFELYKALKEKAIRHMIKIFGFKREFAAQLCSMSRNDLIKVKLCLEWLLK